MKSLFDATDSSDVPFWRLYEGLLASLEDQVDLPPDAEELALSLWNALYESLDVNLTETALGTGFLLPSTHTFDTDET